MRRPRSQLALAAIALLLGFLVVVQLRAQQASTGLETLSSQDLTLLIANLTTRNDGIRAELADLQRQLASIEATSARGDTSRGQLRADLDRVRLWAGLEPASGSGIRVVITGDAPASAISDLLNELRNVGAEAIAVDDVRVTARTVVAGPPGALSVENTALGDRVVITAIGNPPTLTGALTRAGGIAAQIQASYENVGVEVMPRDRVEIPATALALAPVEGKPRP
jgi:uncharacterized protein YlxW (UPF0749 family)